MFSNFQKIGLVAVLAIILGMGAALFHYKSAATDYKDKLEDLQEDHNALVFARTVELSNNAVLITVSAKAIRQKQELETSNKGLRREIRNLLQRDKNNDLYIDVVVSDRLLNRACDLRSNAMSRSGQPFNRAVDCPVPGVRVTYGKMIEYVIDLLAIVEEANIDRSAVSDVQTKIKQSNKQSSERLVK